MPDYATPRFNPAVNNPADNRDVGTGKELGADLYALYRAGNTSFPDIADTYLQVTSALHAVTGQLQYLSASVGNPSALLTAMNLREELQVALYKSTVAVRDTGTALVVIAEDYATTDEGAAKEFNRKMENNPEIATAVPPQVADPPSISDPVPTYYPVEEPSLLDHLQDAGEGFLGSMGLADRG